MCGEELILDKNVFVERILPSATLRKLGDEEMEAYRRPWRQASETRRPMLTWPREIPVGGEPADVVALVAIQRRDDPALAFRYACRVGMCGSCAMVVNGRERWACRTRLSRLGSGPVSVRPLYHFGPGLPALRRPAADPRGGDRAPRGPAAARRAGAGR